MGNGRAEFRLHCGNPPFGGTIDVEIQDALDRRYGWRNGLKIKKETYSFFIVKSLELLKPGGRITFICSDTFLTISTMRGLRRLLMNEGQPAIELLDGFFDETNAPDGDAEFPAGRGGERGSTVRKCYIPTRKSKRRAIFRGRSRRNIRAIFPARNSAIFCWRQAA